MLKKGRIRIFETKEMIDIAEGGIILQSRICFTQRRSVDNLANVVHRLLFIFSFILFLKMRKKIKRIHAIMHSKCPFTYTTTLARPGLKLYMPLRLSMKLNIGIYKLGRTLIRIKGTYA